MSKNEEYLVLVKGYEAPFLFIYKDEMFRAGNVLQTSPMQFTPARFLFGQVEKDEIIACDKIEPYSPLSAEIDIDLTTFMKDKPLNLPSKVKNWVSNNRLE